MEMSFDSEADAVYIQMSDSEVNRTRKVGEKTILDLDSGGDVIGIELLDASNRFDSLADIRTDFSQRIREMAG